jgi:hypothetical protein
VCGFEPPSLPALAAEIKAIETVLSTPLDGTERLDGWSEQMVPTSAVNVKR